MRKFDHKRLQLIRGFLGNPFHQFSRASSVDSDLSKFPKSDPVVGAATVSTVSKTVSMDEIVNICKHRGFIFVSGDIYNPPAGFFDYGVV